MNSTAANLARIPMARPATNFPLNPFLCWLVGAVLVATWWTWFLPLMGVNGTMSFGTLVTVALAATSLLLALPGRTVATRLEWARNRAFDTWRNNAKKACRTAGVFAGHMSIAQIAAEKARWNSLRNPAHRNTWFRQWLVRDGAGNDVLALVNRPANSDTKSIFYAGRVLCVVAITAVVTLLMQPLVLMLLLPGGYAYVRQITLVFVRTNSARR